MASQEEARKKQEEPRGFRKNQEEPDVTEEP
jgi:hypothetical protein